MRTNPFFDAWLFVIGDTGDQSALGPFKYVLVALFLGLIGASVLIAATNWQRDPAQHSPAHVWTWFFRLFIGVMWFQGSIWKLPLPVSGGLQYWTEQMAGNAAFEIHREFVKGILLPYLYLLDPLVFLAELSFGISFILGVAVRFFAALAILHTLHLWLGLYDHPNEWPWLYIFLVFVQGLFIVHAAGRSLGLDALLRRNNESWLAGTGIWARFFRLAS